MLLVTRYLCYYPFCLQFFCHLLPLYFLVLVFFDWNWWTKSDHWDKNNSVRIRHKLYSTDFQCLVFTRRNDFVLNRSHFHSILCHGHKASHSSILLRVIKTVDLRPLIKQCEFLCSFIPSLDWQSIFYLCISNSFLVLTIFMYCLSHCTLKVYTWKIIVCAEYFAEVVKRSNSRFELRHGYRPHFSISCTLPSVQWCLVQECPDFSYAGHSSYLSESSRLNVHNSEFFINWLPVTRFC